MNMQENQLRGQIADLVKRLQATDSISEQAALTKELRDKQSELSAILSQGARPCECGKSPMGILKTPFFEKSNGETIGPVYEVGCVFCPPYLEGPEGREHRVSISSRGRSPEIAVERWNARDFVKDGHVNRIPLGGEPPSPGRKVAQFDESGSWLSRVWGKLTS